MQNLKLGKDTVYKDFYDSSLIDVFPRAEKRVSFTVPMIGVDVWTCYEFSFLLTNGKPWFGVIRIFNPSDSLYIFESKSLKLYLNSFNNTRFEDMTEAIRTIERDLTEKVKTHIQVEFIDEFYESNDVGLSLDHHIDLVNVNEYNYNPVLLTSSKVIGEATQKFYSNLLRSNCPVTNQPDWGRVTVTYQGDRRLEYDSFLRYIISFRNHQGFHEVVCETIFNDLYQVLHSPDYLEVICQYTRRGGIDINPVRSTDKFTSFPVLPKLLQQ